MSKCDIVIEFDRADRTYYTGGIISGTVYITPQANTKCNGIRIELGWATHGRGNKDTETLDSIDHDGMQFVAGKTMACKFRFGAPSAPLTYHGHHLDINHYLAIRLDVPWAIDPKAREQYILLPGDTCESPDETYGIRKIRDTKNANGCVLAVVMIIAIVSLFIGFFPVIIGAWILAMVLGFKVFRNSIAASQLGEVAFTLARRRATPGERLPVSVEFSPTRQISINQISAVLKGVEKVSSGSGKNRKTHTETICEQHCILCEATQLSIGKQVLSSEILIPQTNAWTFHAKNNKLIWTVTLRVDIPNWPDWVTSTEFGLIPASGSQIKQQREKPTPRPTPPPIEPPPVTPPPVAIAVETPDPVPPDPTEPKAQPVVQDNSASDAAQYASDLEAIINADNSSQQQDNLIDQMTERLYDLNVTIKSTSWTLDFSMLPEYRNGRTIIATVQDAGDAEIAIHFPEEANSKISSLPKGTTLHLAVRPREFNKFYKRMEAMAENP